ncbi:beta-alanine-activating enzyme [Ceratina calcarata]|uniref:Beta-alanine-activating enzyme n=1 Tax=Ceratina calcarata TaxID=156304 RepID=A0AAJ7N6J2_9HYME|nr:beta-alanine-activating enzyme [Ceratina calcarata]
MDIRKEFSSFDPRCENSVTKLHDICNWDQLDDVAIEYHDLQENIYIQYRELHVTKNIISDYLKSLRNTEFIGIDYDIPEYCVIPLIVGILNSEHSFVNLPSSTTESMNLKYDLNIQYLFCKNVNIKGEVVYQFTVHSECIYLIKLKNVKKQVTGSDEQNSYAYAISTSGSTGTPKTVRVLHSCIVPNILDLSRILSITKFDKVCQFTNFTFDPSVIEIFLALSKAARLFMVSKDLKNNPNRLLREAYSSQITVLQVTPSVFMYNWPSECLRTTILSNNTSLRVILFGGEPFPKLELFSQARQPCNTTKIYNIYGITEVSCWASITEVELTNEQSDPHYLGQVLSGTLFQVRNEIGEVITKGVGSLYIGSDQRICLMNDEDIKDLELPVFRDSGDLVSIDGEGRIFYKGRRNNIVKRFGNKVDLTEIERSVLQIDFIKSCYVIWDHNCHRLHLCFSAKDRTSIGNDQNLGTEIMRRLNKLDPLYRPDKIHFLDHVELTSSSKISLDFLQKQVTKDVDNVDFQRIESTFKSIWENNLQRGNSSFIKLGGTSVVALQLSNAMSDMLQMEFPRLISMLLTDASIDESLSYIKGVVLSRNDNFYNTGEKPSTTIITIEDTDISRDFHTNEQDDNSNISSSEIYNCRWYKCRGQLYTNACSINEKHELQYDEITRVKVIKKYDTEKCVDASPTVFHYSDGKTYATVGSHSGLIFTFELGSDFNSAFRIKLPDRIESSVLVLDDFRGVVGCYDCNIYCLNLKTGETIWVHRTGNVVKGSAVLCNEKGILFIGSYDCYIYCLSVKDGSEVWKLKSGNGSIYATGCLHYPSDTVLFGTLDGSCLALQQSTGKLVWKYKLSDPIFVAPLWLNGGLVLFCSVTGLLCCFDIEVNVKMWTYKINGNVFSYLVKQIDTAREHETVIITSQNKSVYCLQSEDTNFKTEPTLKYVLNFHSPIFATPWCEDNFLLIACTDGTLNIYDFKKNRLMKIEELPGKVFSSPVIDRDNVIIGCRDNYIYVLELI